MEARPNQAPMGMPQERKPQGPPGPPDQMHNSRSVERMILVLYTLHQISILALAYMQKWDSVEISLIFMTLAFSWLVFIGKYKNFHFRAGFALVMVYIALVIYSVHVGEITSSLLPLTSIAVLTGLYGFSDLTKISFITWAFLVLYHGPIMHHFEFGTIAASYEYGNPIANAFLAIFAVNFWVSKRKESGNRLMEVIERQKKTEKSKDEFLANLSHEIRTPINTISGMSELLLTETDSEKMRQEAKAIQLGSRNLMNVVRDIIDFSELISGNIEIIEDTYDVTSVINDIVRMTMAQKEDKPLEIIVDIDAKIPRKLLGDEKKIRRMVMYIIDNAIKFTNEGGVYIQIGARKEAYGVNLVFTVRDTGIGMSQKNQDKLFSVYNQADTSTRRAEGGIGLGLPIAQTIVHQMGGVITVKSKQGEGTIMRIAIPQRIIDEQPMVQFTDSEINQSIIYLDMEEYDSSIRDSYAELIQHISDSVPGKTTICRNLPELKRRTQNDQYDFVVTGYQEYLREKEYFDHLATKTAVTVIIDESEAKEEISSDIYVICRPLTILAVASIIQSTRCKQVDGIAKKHDKFIAPDAKVLVVDDNFMNIKVVEGLLKKYQVNVVYALSGIEAIEKAASRDYDFIFMDHMMPEMDGVEAMKRIRNMGGSYCTNVPIIALTANAVAGAREALIAEGFSDFVEKPIELAILEKTLLHNLPANKIQYLTDAKTAMSESQTIESMTEEKTEAHTVQPVSQSDSEAFFVKDLDMNTGMMYCGGEEAYKLILEEYARKGSKNWEDLARLFQEMDWKNYTIAVHAIKSSMLSIGAKELSEQAKALEFAGKAGDIDFIQKNHSEMLALLKQTIANIVEAVGMIDESESEEELLPEISEDEFEHLAIAFEDAMYDLDGVAMKQILEQLSQYSFYHQNLKQYLDPVAHKVEMADYMSAVEVVLHLRDKLKQEE